MPSLNTLLTTAVLAFILYNIHASPALGTITVRLALFAFAAWVLAAYGDGLADIIGLSSNWSASKYTGPFMLGLGCTEAMNLDGGSSSQLLVRAGDRRRHLPGRLVPALIAIIPR